MRRLASSSSSSLGWQEPTTSDTSNQGGSWLGLYIFFGIILIIVFIVYKICTSTSVPSMEGGQRRTPSTGGEEEDIGGGGWVKPGKEEVKKEKAESKEDCQGRTARHRGMKRAPHGGAQHRQGTSSGSRESSTTTSSGTRTASGFAGTRIR